MAAPEPALRLSLQQARLLHLAAQGLLLAPRRRARKADVLAAIERMRLLQIDTIHVVARSPYLVLYSRLGAYRAAWLDELLAEAAIFECWGHEACFAPIADYPLHRRHLLEGSRHWAIRRARRFAASHRADIDAMLARIRTHGPLRSSDFERRDGDGNGGGWWGWKTDKSLLEAAFALGELMIARREHFQRVYDVPERVLAPTPFGSSPADLPPLDEVRRRFVLGAVRALGITEARWIADYFRMGRRIKDADLDGLVEEGVLMRVAIAGRAAPAYVHRDHRQLAERATAGRLRATRTTVLSPFDPVIWDRERASELFGFDYRLECYTPATRRRFGYYVLPILHRGRLVGRLDAKAHRSDEVFEVKVLYLEDRVAADAALATALAAALHDCAAWHAAPRVTIGRCEPRGFAKLLRAALG
jgi:uncharacterized protein YcaQ